MATRGRVATRHTYGSARSVIPTSVRTTSKSTSTGAFLSDSYSQMLQSRDRTALLDLTGGKLLPFIEYARQRITIATSDDDRARWQSLLDQAKERVEEETLSQGLQSGEVDLETALGYLERTRSKYQPYEPQFADLTKQIADVKNGIAARDFNDEVNSAVGDMVESGSTLTAKQTYLEKLLLLLPRAKDPKAQQAIQAQMQELQKAITQDRITARTAETSAKLIGYYTGKVSGAEIQDFLLEKAQTSLSGDEANAYLGAAKQVATREATLQTQAVRAAAARSSGGGGGGRSGGGGGGGGSASTGVTAALATLTKSTKAAGEAFSNTIKRSGQPDAQAFGLFSEAAQNELSAIEQALPLATGSAANTLLARREAILNDLATRSTAAATKTVQTQKDLQASFKDTLDTLKKQGANPEETARLTAARLAAVVAAQRVPWLQGLQESPTLGSDLRLLENDVRKMLTDEAAVSARVITGETPTTKKLDEEYQRYRQSFVASGKPIPVTQDEWLRAMTGGGEEKAIAAKLGLSSDGSSLSDLRVERDNLQRIKDARGQEIQTAADRHIAATWPRDETGARFPFINAPMAGDPLRDQSAILLNDPTLGGTISPPGYGPPPSAAGVGGRSPSPIDFGTGANEADQMRADQLETRRAQYASMDPHDAADLYLSQPTSFPVFTWELPSLPDFGAFNDTHLDPGAVDQYVPPSYVPPAPSFSPAPYVAHAAQERTDMVPPPEPTYEPPPEPTPGQKFF